VKLQLFADKPEYLDHKRVVWTWTHTAEKSGNEISLLQTYDMTNFVFFDCPYQFNVSKKKNQQISPPQTPSVSRKAPLAFVHLTVCQHPSSQCSSTSAVKQIL